MDHKSLLTIAIESLLEAVHEMMNDDSIASRLFRIVCFTTNLIFLLVRMDWSTFIEKIAECIGVILKREAHEKLVKDVNMKLANGATTFANDGESFIGKGPSAAAELTSKAVRLSKTLYNISHRLKVVTPFQSLRS